MRGTCSGCVLERQGCELTGQRLLGLGRTGCGSHGGARLGDRLWQLQELSQDIGLVSRIGLIWRELPRVAEGMHEGAIVARSAVLCAARHAACLRQGAVSTHVACFTDDRVGSRLIWKAG